VSSTWPLIRLCSYFVKNISSSKFLSNATVLITSRLCLIGWKQSETLRIFPKTCQTRLVHPPDCCDGEGDGGYFLQEGELYLVIPGPAVDINCHFTKFHNLKVSFVRFSACSNLNRAIHLTFAQWHSQQLPTESEVCRYGTSFAILEKSQLSFIFTLKMWARNCRLIPVCLWDFMSYTHANLVILTMHALVQRPKASSWFK